MNDIIRDIAGEKLTRKLRGELFSISEKVQRTRSIRLVSENKTQIFEFFHLHFFFLLSLTT